MHQLYCPTCDQRAISEIRRIKKYVVTSDAICDNGHLWQAKWLLPTIPIDTEAS